VEITSKNQDSGCAPLRDAVGFHPIQDSTVIFILIYMKHPTLIGIKHLLLIYMKHPTDQKFHMAAMHRRGAHGALYRRQIF
jgi:hypothetical protein